MPFVPNAGDLCLVMDDNDLVNLILHSKQQEWILGQDLGIISYNETPLKSVVGDGISTITPDYEQMGTSMTKHSKRRGFAFYGKKKMKKLIKEKINIFTT